MLHWINTKHCLDQHPKPEMILTTFSSLYTYPNSRHRYCTATMKSLNHLNSLPPFPATCWILTCGSSSPRRLYMAFSPVSPSMILASSSSPTAWCLSQCLSLPLAYNRKETLIHLVTWVYVRQSKTYWTWHTHEFSL